MFINPRKSGVIVIGSDRFDGQKNFDRACFRHAAEAYIEYFKSDGGLNIPDRNIKSLFGVDCSVEDLYARISAFLQDEMITDLFVVVVSHGKIDVEEDSPPKKLFQAPFRIMIRSSNPDYPRPSYVYFDDLDKRLTHASSANRLSCRKYYIIDACMSGAVLGPSVRRRRSIETAENSYSFLNEKKLPAGGAVAITSNNPSQVGFTIASDGLSDLQLPLFSQCLLQVLTNGATSSHPAFNIVELRDATQRLIEAFLERHPEHIDYVKTSVPAVTELDVPKDSDDEKGRLFEFEVFPNNAAGHASIVGSARRFRLLENRLDESNEFKNRIFQEKEKLAKELSTERVLRRAATKRAHQIEKNFGGSLSRMKLALYLVFLLLLGVGAALFLIARKLGIP